jgi:hypothetical protein
MIQTCVGFASTTSLCTKMVEVLVSTSTTLEDIRVVLSRHNPIWLSCLPEMHGQGEIGYFQRVDFLLILLDSGSEIIELLFLISNVLKAFVLYCNCALQNGIIPCERFQLSSEIRYFPHLRTGTNLG